MKRLFNRLLFCVMLNFSLLAQADIQTDNDLQIDKLAADLQIPWGMAYLPDNSLLITQREGRLVRLTLASGKITTISGLPADIAVGGQGGLFDVALSPDYDQSHWIYFSYSKTVKTGSATTLARAKLVGDTLSDWQELFVTRIDSSKRAHFGGRIAFDGTGHVFLSSGERGHRANAQDLTNHAGKILRLNMDGSVPTDNPFVGQTNALPEIWSYGHRNPQGLCYNKETEQLWEIEHGPRGGDEINLIQPGHNYGWPVISYGKEYWAPLAVGEGTHKQGMDQPVYKYIPSIAPSSLLQYQGALFKQWHGRLLAGALSLQHLNVVELNEENQFKHEQRLLNTLNSRIRSLLEGPDGELYIGTDQGDIYRVTPKDKP